jgi:uncharacterized protein YbjQ (UPF0145 family)
MKKFIVLVSAVALFASCHTTDFTTNKVGWSNYTDISVKDFQAVGVVSLESQEVYTYGPMGFKTSYKGSRIVWSDLMAEAAKLGADDVINVRIEQTNQNYYRPWFVEFFTGYAVTYKYKATALAIKYTGFVDRQKSGRMDNLKGQDK